MGYSVARSGEHCFYKYDNTSLDRIFSCPHIFLVQLNTMCFSKSLPDVNTKDSFGKTPLHNAILGERVAIVDILLKSGADVKCQDERGDTPLHNAVRVESLEIVEVRTSSSTKYLAICQLFSSQLCVYLSLRTK